MLLRVAPIWEGGQFLEALAAAVREGEVQLTRGVLRETGLHVVEVTLGLLTTDGLQEEVTTEVMEGRLSLEVGVVGTSAMVLGAADVAAQYEGHWCGRRNVRRCGSGV